MSDTEKMNCPDCGAEMNHHADKLDYGAAEGGFDDTFDGGAVVEAHSCPGCGRTATRPAPAADNAGE